MTSNSHPVKRSAPNQEAIHNLSDRLNNLSESQTLQMAKQARQLKAEGHDIISLSLGEPDFDTPEHIRQAAKKAIDEGYTHYPPVAGYPDLREAIVQKLQRDNGLRYTTDQVMVSNGAKHVLANIMQALLNAGDEVVIPAPYWVSYPEMVKLAEGKPCVVPTGIKQDFKITPEQLEAAINDRTRILLFASPSNPTGMVYTKNELEALAAVLRKHPKIIVVSDEIYEYIHFEGEHQSIAALPQMQERTIVVNGVSKGFAMTGWRIGYMAGPREVVAACEKIQGQVTSGPNAVAQRAALAALTGDMQPVHDMRKAFLKRRDRMLELLGKLPGFHCPPPQGAFFLFPNIKAWLGKSAGSTKIDNATDLSTYLLHEAHVAVVTGAAFGNPDCIRISYANSIEQLEAAVKRIEQAMEKLR